MEKISILFLSFAVLEAFFPQLPHAAPAQDRKKVLILGAGAAGITAAKTLHDHRITDFLVLEGQDYIGGRIKQVQFANISMEQGARWIHFVEEEDNPLVALRNKYNMTGTISKFDDLRMRNETGSDVTDHKLLGEWANTTTKLFDMGEERGEQDIPPRDMPASVALKLLGWKSDSAIKKILSWYDLDFEYGEDADETSLNNLGAPGEYDMFVTDQRGYWSIFSDFYANFKNKILLNKTVTKIKYDNSGVEVMTKGGETFTADYALFTFSSGVLGSDSVEFDPPLPEWKREAIFRFNAVYFTAIFLKFPRDFWDDNEWILHISENTGHFPAFLDLDRSGFFPNSTALYTAVVGDESLRVEAQDDSKTMEEVMEVLRKMYGPSIPNATDIFVSTWSTNPFTRCAWTDPVIGTSNSHYDNMAGRLKNLFFAGEATSSEWYGYVQGAYFTGQDKANEIAGCIKGGECKSFVPSTGLPVVVKTEKPEKCTVPAAATNCNITFSVWLCVVMAFVMSFLQ